MAGKLRKTKQAAVVGAATAALLAGGNAATRDYTPPPLPACSTFADVKASQNNNDADISAFQTVTDLVDNPVSAASLAVQAILNHADTTHELDKIAGGKITPYVTYKENAYSEAYIASCQELRSPLFDVTLFDPSKYDANTYEEEKLKPENQLHFKAVAHYENKETGDKAIALLHAETGTLVISTIGLTETEGKSRMWGVLSGDPKRTVHMDFTGKFLQELAMQIEELNIPVRATIFSSHSMGVANGLTMLAQTHQSERLQKAFGGIPPLVAMESFGESLAAEETENLTGLPVKKMADNIYSVRVSPATFIGHEWDNNQAVGNERYGMVRPEGEKHDYHRLATLAELLTTGKMPVEKHEGKFGSKLSERWWAEALQAIGKIAEKGRNVREGLGR